MENDGELHAVEQRIVVEALHTLERTVAIIIIIIDPSMVPTNCQLLTSRRPLRR
jgi:hypothetical protein